MLTTLLQKEGVYAYVCVCVCLCVYVYGFMLFPHPKDKAAIYVTSKLFHIVYVVPYRSTMSRLD